MPDRTIGVDSSKLPGARTTPHATLEEAAALGYGGVLFRSVLELDSDLDPVALDEVGAHAKSLGLRIEAGIGKVNPYMTAEYPDIRALGDGDYMLALRMMIEACAVAGITEIWTATANWKRQYPGRFQFDRFRTDAPWADQLRAIERVLRGLSSVLADVDVHLNVETHEEITSFEVVHLVEEVGPDVLGITFDVANVFVNGEDPVEAARRCAVYTRMTHLRDVALWSSESGFWRFVVEFGRGVVNWEQVAAALRDAPIGMLTVEGLEPGGGRSCKPVDVRDREWMLGHPDLGPTEPASLSALCEDYMSAAQRGAVDDLQELNRVGDQARFLVTARSYLAEHAAMWGCKCLA